jgi:glycosyltransferase involved in cell wall biosynthesis
MKILYFHQHFSTPNGSTGTRSYEFSKALIRAGHEVTVICGSYWIADSGLSSNFINGKRIGIVEGIRVIELELPYSNSDGLLKRTLLFLKYSFSGIQIALKSDYDLLFSTSTPLTAGIPGIIAKYLRNKPFVFEVRDLWPELPRAMGVISNPFVLTLLSMLETISYKSADRCVALAPGIAEGIKKKYRDKEVIVIPNGSDELNPSIKNIKKVTANFVAVFTGAHGRANGLGAVLDVAALLLAYGQKNIEIQLIGDGGLKQSLIKRAQSDALTNIKFIDPMPKVDLFKYLAENANVGLMILDNIPEFYRGTSPNKFFDYIALGLPVLNNYPGWIAEIIRSENCGAVVAPGSAEEFAQTLLYFRDNPEILEVMSTSSKRLSITQFNRKNLSNMFVSFLEIR